MKMLVKTGVAGMMAFAALPALAQESASPPMNGTRLDVVGTGEVTRVPDIARITAGVVTLAPTATAAIEQNATRMASVRAALRRAGIVDRDVQTSTVSLNPEYRYADNQPPVLTGYQASNNVTIRFRDIRTSGQILDALVAQGANQINGPMLSIDKPDAALDEARVAAIANARSRAELYARTLGKRIVRIISVSEAGGSYAPPQAPMMMVRQGAVAKTEIDPGEQTLSVSISASFELE